MTGRTLYLHIGCHKTGTTSIQHSLAHNFQALQDNGLSFFYTDRKTGNLLLPDLHSWLGFVEKGKPIPRGMRVHELERLVEQLSRFEGNVIISSENFSFFFEDEHIRALKEGLAEVFQDIQVICYIRRQDRHIISHHQEGSKTHRETEYALYGHDCRALPPYDPRHRIYLDYNTRLMMWAQTFGAKNLMVRIYDRKVLRDGDVVSDFFELIGVTSYQKINDENLSVGLSQAKLGHLLNGASLNHKQVLSYLIRIVSGGLSRDRGLPSRCEALEYYKYYTESNIALNSHLSISPVPELFDNDFSDYPENAQDIWTEQSSNEVIIKILEFLDSTYAALTVNELRDAGINLSSERPETAIKLLRIAAAYRPEGHLIRRKLEELEKKLSSQGLNSGEAN